MVKKSSTEELYLTLVLKVDKDLDRRGIEGHAVQDTQCGQCQELEDCFRRVKGQ